MDKSAQTFFGRRGAGGGSWAKKVSAQERLRSEVEGEVGWQRDFRLLCSAMVAVSLGFPTMCCDGREQGVATRSPQGFNFYTRRDTLDRTQCVLG